MSYIGNEPIVSATRTVTEAVASAGQTTFTPNGGYTVGFLDVFVNGALLQASDFTATNGTSVVLNTACVAGDEVRLVAYGTFTTSSSYTQAQVDAKIGNLGPVQFRNRIINGDMRIDQRNAGASVTPTNGSYTLDRWQAGLTQASKFTVQQNAGSVARPAGFTNYLGATVGAAANVTVGAGDYFNIRQNIEGLNVADLGWGAAGAQTVTLSFWVRSSLTGTFGGSLYNFNGTRSYPFTYSISAANTWEQKTVTVAGDTSGTWKTDTDIGLSVGFALGAGSTYSGTAGAWAGSWLLSATGATNLIATNNATFYITGVQLEAGTVASPFERRDYGRELIMCQRYYEKSYGSTQVPGTASVLAGAIGPAGNGGVAASTAGECGRGFRLGFAVQKRATPTMVLYDWTGTANAVRVYPSDGMRSGVTSLNQITDSGSCLNINFDNSSATAITSSSFIAFNWTASAEL